MFQMYLRFLRVNLHAIAASLVIRGEFNRIGIYVTGVCTHPKRRTVMHTWTKQWSQLTGGEVRQGFSKGLRGSHKHKHKDRTQTFDYIFIDYGLHSQKRASCSQSAITKPISGCVRIACSGLMITSLLQVVNKLAATCELPAGLMQVVSLTCNKSANIKLQQV